MATGPRDRLIESAIELVREHGVHAAGLAALLDRSHASRNSLYQHFPSGKSELVEAATRTAGDRMTVMIGNLTRSGSPEQWVAALVDWWKQGLEKSEFIMGCPIVGAALAESEPRVQAAAGAAFTDWTGQLAAALAASGFPADRARVLAGFTISAMEGAIVQARAIKSTQPLDDVVSTIGPLLSTR